MLFFFFSFINILISVAFFTIAERKIMAAIQRRKGPNVVGLIGLGQPLADGLKLLMKEILIPVKAEKILFIAAPLLIITISLLLWILIPGGSVENMNANVLILNNFLDLNVLSNDFFLVNNFSKYFNVSLTTYSLLFVLALSSLNVYGFITAGWASYSKYAFLGSLRSSAQMISYEVSITLILLPIVLLNNSFSFTELSLNQLIFGWNCFFLLPLTFLFFISMLAETNRTPFDLPEAEAELVAGYNVEYSSIIFAMFFLGEYSNMLIMSVIFSILFFGSWNFIGLNSTLLTNSVILAFKVISFCFCFILVRALVPRYKYNQLMNLGWKLFLPFSVSFLFFVVSFFSLF